MEIFRIRPLSNDGTKIGDTMKAMGIIGSPRKDGNTAYLLGKSLDILKEGNVEIETIFLKDHEIKPCEGCKYCTKHGKCKIEDGMQELYPKLEESDIIIMTSPVYMGGVTSRTRAFMERTWPLRKGQLENTIGTSIVVGRRDIGSTVNEMNEYLDRLRVIKVSGILGYGFEGSDILNDGEAINGAVNLGKKILTILERLTEQERIDNDEPFII